jgi:hypothetical protein
MPETLARARDFGLRSAQRDGAVPLISADTGLVRRLPAVRIRRWHMLTLERLKNVADELKSKVDEVGAAALEQLGKSHRELNETIPILKGLGLSVRNFKVDLALVPVIRLTLVGNVAAIEPDKLKAAIDMYKEKKLLVSVLEALRTAALLKNQLGDLGFRGVSADIVLSVPPAVNVEFLKDPPPLDV